MNLTRGKIFGFKYNMKYNQDEFDPNEQTAARYRLFARVIHVIGISQISDLQPFLQANLERTSIEEIDSQSPVDGMSLNTAVVALHTNR